MFKAAVNNCHYDFHSLTELERVLKEGHDQEYREIWVEHGKRTMCALAAGHRAWLLMMRFPEDCGLSSRNRDYAGGAGETMKFRLSNGQIDEYPVAWTLPNDVWVPAMLLFAETGKLSKSVGWHQEGGE